MDPVNPYAPPVAPETSAELPPEALPSNVDLDEVRRRLAAHCADATAIAMDKQLAGGRLRVGTYVSGALLLACLLLMTAGSEAIIIGAIFGAIMLILFLVFLVRDLRIGPRPADSTATAAMLSYVRASLGGHDGYVVSALTPTAREETCSPPNLGPVPVPGTSHVLGSKAGVKDYFRTFARPGTGQYRYVQFKGGTLEGESGDVAKVSVTATVSAIPQWAYTTAILLFVFIRLIGLIVGAIVFFVMRKQTKVKLTKTFLRGPDGLWYALHGGWEHEIEPA
jgi:hypothetical protein